MSHGEGGATSGTATVLFSDVVGSTEQRVALGDVRADELRRRHDEALGSVIERHGGTVVKSLGDGLMATFEGASDGAAAGVDLQREIVRLNRTAPDGERLSIRVGLSAGDVSWDDGDCHGTPVVVAARLCDAAAVDQILCDDLVRGLARGRSELSFSLVGEIELKGLDEPTVTYSIPWVADAVEPGAPLPGALRPTPGELPYGGRDEDRAALFDQWKEAASGVSSTVLIQGEPGIGKTRLIAELAREVHSTGAIVTLGRCDEHIQAPNAPWSEALRTLLSGMPVQALDDHVRTHGTVLARIVPELLLRVEGAAPGQIDPDTERLRLFNASVALIEAAAANAPVLIVFDDAHWADSGSVALLRHLTARIDPDAPVLVAVTFRDTDIDRTHAFGTALADLRRDGRAELIALRGLDESGIRSFLEHAGGHELDREEDRAFVRRLAAETEGNPFFLTELLRHLAQTGALVQDDDGRWVGTVSTEEGGIPAGVRDLVGQRLSQLDDEVNHLLRIAAVIGREFDIALLAEVAERSEDDLIDLVDEVIATRLVEEVPDTVGRVTFQHALVRQTLLEELSTNRRVRVHRQIGDALERRSDTSSSVLAHHYCEAALAGRADKAVQYALAAAHEGLDALAFEDVITIVDRATDAYDAVVDPDPRTEAQLLVVGARARHYAVESEVAKALALRAADIARTHHDPALLAEAGQAYLGEAGMWATLGDPVGIDILTEALDALPDEVSTERARASAALAHAMILAPGRQGFDTATRALGLAEAANEVDAALWAHEALAWTTTGTVSFPEAEEIVRRGLDAARSANSRRSELSLEYQLLKVQIGLGQLGAAEETVERANAYNASMAGWSRLGYAAARSLAEGRWHDAAELSEATLPLGQMIGETNDMLHYSRMQRFASGQGLVEDARRWHDAGASSLLAVSTLSAIQYHLLVGDLDEVRRLLESWPALAPNAPNMMRFYAWANLARGAFRIDDLCGNESELHDLERYAGCLIGGDANILGAADWARGQMLATLGQLDDAVELTRAGHELHVRLGLHALAAESALTLGQVLGRRDGPGDTDSATSALLEALDLAERLGMTPTAEAAQATLDR